MTDRQLVLDAAYPVWTPEQLKSNGVHGVCRYVGNPHWSKAITKAEYDRTIAAGIPIMLNFESTGTSWRYGYEQGVRDGAAARAHAREVGHPDDRPIVFSADEGVPFSMLDTLAEYHRGVNAGDGTGRPQGFYGTAMAIDFLWGRGLISLAWQTNARGWEGNRPDSVHASLFQRTSRTLGWLPGPSYDENDVGKTDWGQHPAPTDTPATPATPAPPQEHDMILQPKRKPVPKNAPGPAAAVLDINAKSVILYNGSHLRGDHYVKQWNLDYWLVVDDAGKQPAHPLLSMVEIEKGFVDSKGRKRPAGIMVIDTIGKAYFAEWA